MAKKTSRRLVIDASVARACGKPESTHPTGTRCREFLEAVKKISHHVVMTPDISVEWRKHQSASARLWLVQMYARRNVYRVEPDTDVSLIRRLERTKANARERKAMLKDMRLIEAAGATDHTVVSLDDSARRLFVRASDEVVELQKLVWTNPNHPKEAALEWLETGAQPDRERMLGWERSGGNP